MIRLKLLLKTILSLPVVPEMETHFTVTFCVLGYGFLLFLVLKTFSFNRDRFGK